MFRTIVTLALIVMLVFGCWWAYKQINGEGTLGAGNVYVTNPGTSKDNGDSDPSLMGDKPLEEARPTPSRSDTPGTINTEPVAGYSNNATGNAPPQPDTLAQPVTPQPPVQPYNQQPYGQIQTQPDLGRPSYVQDKPLSANDTFAPNSPNGMAYSGTGKFEVYRQGDLTFRMNTKTGESCVLFATVDEWRKPIVYSHGCGSQGLHKRPRG